MCWVKEVSEDEKGENKNMTYMQSGGSNNTSIYRDRSNLLLKPRTISRQGSHGVDKHSFKSYASALMDMPLFGVESTPRNKLEILVSGDRQGVVTMSAFGYFSIGCIDLSGAFESAGISSSKAPEVRHVCLSDNLRMLIAILECDEHVRLVTVDTSVLAERSNELRHIASQSGHVSELIAYVQTALLDMSKQWESGMTALKKHMAPLEHQLKCFDRPNTPEQELFMMLTCGVTSAALQAYIDNLQEQSLQRLAKTLDSACASVEEVATNTLAHSTQGLVFRLHDMLGLAQWKEKFEPIGLKVEMAENLLDAAKLLFLKVQQVLTWVRDARANFAAFTVWLQTVWRKNQKPDDSGGNQASKKHFAHIDIDRLVNLLSSKLLHDHITEQFQLGPLSVSQDPSDPTQLSSPTLPSQTFFSSSPASWTSAGRYVDPHVSLQQAFAGLVDNWRKAFHCTSETVSKAFNPVENRELQGAVPRLLDVAHFNSDFFVVLGSKQGDLTMFRRSTLPRDKPQMVVKRASLSGVQELTDVRFYNDTSVLLTFQQDGRRYIGDYKYSIMYDRDSADQDTSQLERQRPLVPSGWTTANLVCQGKRGIAIVFTGNKRLCLLDIEDEEDDEDDDDDDGDEVMG